MKSSSFFATKLGTLVLSVFFLLIGYSIFLAAHSLYSQQELVHAGGRLSLYRNMIEDRIERISYLPFILARNTDVRAAVETAQDSRQLQKLNKRLSLFSQRTDLEALYLMDSTGLTIASSNFDQDQTFLGKNYAFRPYFQQAMQGQQGRLYAIGVTSKNPGYFIAEPVYNQQQKIAGVMVVKMKLETMERIWKDSGEQVFVASRDGIILLSSDRQLRYQSLYPLSEDRLDEIRATRAFIDKPLTLLSWTSENATHARLQGTDYLYVSTDVLPNAWELYYFVEMRSVYLLAWFWLIGYCSVLLIGFSIFQTLKNKRFGSALQHARNEELLLRESNRRLAGEVEERKRTKNILEQTQRELMQANRLAVLGQLSVSVTHELGQPLSAMRNYIAAAEISKHNGQTSDIQLRKIGDLVERMEHISSQLKFFASRPYEGTKRVNLRDVINNAIALMQTDFESNNIDLQLSLSNQSVNGNQLRLEQVLTNLLRNANKAMQQQAPRELSLSLFAEQGHAIIEVADRGEGLGDLSLTQLQEPFYTTRPSDQGIGLGLTISTEIIKEHNGVLTASNRDGGGAVFSIQIELADTLGLKGETDDTA